MSCKSLGSVRDRSCTTDYFESSGKDEYFEYVYQYSSIDNSLLLYAINIIVASTRKHHYTVRIYTNLYLFVLCCYYAFPKRARYLYEYKNNNQKK